MLIRLLFIFGIAAMFLASGFYCQVKEGFYFMEKAAWVWLFDYSQDYKTLPDFITKQLYIIGFAIPLYFLSLLVFSTRLKVKTLSGGQNQKNLHGSAHWAKWSDLKKAGLVCKQGVVVGGFKKGNKLKTLFHNGPEHILCFAPTGSGKGVGLVLPTLLTWEHSTLVLDIKGENYQKTAGWRASQGQKILKFDPTALTGSAKFNPLEEVRLGTDYEIQDAQNIAIMIIDPEGKGLKDFWVKGGFKWLTAGILYTLYKILADKKRTASLYDVAMTMSSEGLEKLLKEMLALNPEFNEKPRDDAKNLIYASAKEMQDRAASERSGIHSSATIELALYQDPIIAKNIHSSDFAIKDLIDAKNPVSLYLIIPPSDISRIKPLLRVMMNIILTRLTAKLPEDETGRLLLMLDEFTSIGKLEIFEKSLAFMRGYGLKAFIIVQDLTQLRHPEAYGRNESIMSNCNIRIAYAPNQIETAKILSDMSGKTTVVQQKTSSSKRTMELTGNLSTSLSETARPLLTPDECMQLSGAIKSKRNPEMVVKGGDMLIFPAGFAPILGKQALYFQDKELLRRSNIPAPEAPKVPGEKKPEAPEVPGETQPEENTKPEFNADDLTKQIMEGIA